MRGARIAGALGLWALSIGCGSSGGSSGAGAAATTGATTHAATTSGGTTGTGGSTAGTGGTTGSGGTTSATSTGFGGAGTGGTTGSGTGGAVGTGGSGTGGSGSVGAPCVWPQGCNAGLYCKASACGAGTCTTKPAFATNDPAIVCGCDHVTYWNQDAAALAGVSVASAGPCTGAMAQSCDATTPCPAGLRCNRQVVDQTQCSASAPGKCWWLPPSCPVTGTSGHACTNSACATQCSLIASEHPWWDDGLCP